MSEKFSINSSRHWILSCSITIQFTPSHHISLRTILILSFRLRQGHFPLCFPTKNLYLFLTSIRLTGPLHLVLLHLITIAMGFDSRRGLGIFLFAIASRTALELTQLPILWVPGALSLGVKRRGREADHSPPSSAEVKECVELYLHSPIRFHGVVLS
jgi:hypothetical protein